MPHEMAILQVTSDYNTSKSVRWATKKIGWIDSLRVGEKYGREPLTLIISKINEPTVIEPQRVVNFELISEDHLEALIREDGWKEFHPYSQ